MKRLRSLEGFTLFLTVLGLFFGIIQSIASWDTAMDRLNRWLPAISDGIRVLASIANLPIPLWIVIILLTGIPFTWAFLQKRAKKVELDSPIELDIPLAKDNYLGVLILTNPNDPDPEPILLCEKCNSRIVGATRLDSLDYLVCENQHGIGNKIPFEQSLKNAVERLKQWEIDNKKRKAQAEKARLEVRAKVESGELAESDYEKFLRDAPPLSFSEQHPPFVPTDYLPLLRESEFIIHEFYQQYLRNLLIKNLHKIPNIKG
jgi:hypothetical protein